MVRFDFSGSGLLLIWVVSNLVFSIDYVSLCELYVRVVYSLLR